MIELYCRKGHLHFFCSIYFLTQRFNGSEDFHFVRLLKQWLQQREQVKHLKISWFDIFYYYNFFTKYLVLVYSKNNIIFGLEFNDIVQYWFDEAEILFYMFNGQNYFIFKFGSCSRIFWKTSKKGIIQSDIQYYVIKTPFNYFFKQ